LILYVQGLISHVDV